MSDPLVDYERLWTELERSHKQIVAGHAIHLPTFHRIVKALEASVLGVMSARQTLPIVKSSLRARQCDGKRRFDNVQSASAHLLTTSGKLEAYPCVFCGYVHVGHPRREVLVSRPSEVQA